MFLCDVSVEKKSFLEISCLGRDPVNNTSVGDMSAVSARDLVICRSQRAAPPHPLTIR